MPDIIPYDAEDLDRMIRNDQKKITIKEVVNIPIVITGHHVGTSKFEAHDENGEVIRDEAGKPVHSQYIAITCHALYPKQEGLPEKMKDGKRVSFTTQSKKIIDQVQAYWEHFMRNNVPVPYRNVAGIIKYEGKRLKIFTSRNALMQPVYDYSDAYESLEEAGSPITPEDCKYGSTRDEETIEYEKNNNNMTMLLGDPNDLSNDTTLSKKIRNQFKKNLNKSKNNDKITT